MLAGLRSRWTTPSAVRDLQPVGDREADRDRLLDRVAPAALDPPAHAVLQRPAVGEVHDEVRPSVRKLVDVVDADDVIRVGPPEDARLLEEALPDLVVVRPVLGEDLDRDRSRERLVLGEPDRGERTRADDALGAVPPDIGRARPCHRPGIIQHRCSRCNRRRRIGPLQALRIVTSAGEVTAEPGAPFTVGRGTSASLRIDDPLVSREHLRLHAVDGAWLVEDTGSSNGTFVDGERVESFRVEQATTVRLGDAESGPWLELSPVEAPVEAPAVDQSSPPPPTPRPGERTVLFPLKAAVVDDRPQPVLRHRARRPARVEEARRAARGRRRALADPRPRELQRHLRQRPPRRRGRSRPARPDRHRRLRVPRDGEARSSRSRPNPRSASPPSGSRS